MKNLLKSKISEIRSVQPLIHCITNHISINDCANAVLALGAKPIMAEHPDEVSEITACAQSLAVNLGNISGSRMKAIINSGRTAAEYKLPVVLDAAGVSCSKLRHSFAVEFICKYHPSVVKGNEAEIRALCGLECHAKGVDSMEDSTEEELMNIAGTASERLGAVVLISGKADAVSDGNRTALIHNGSGIMPYITGTGCMQGMVCGTFLSAAPSFEAAVCAASAMGIAGEYAQEKFSETQSISSFRSAIHDGLFISEKLTERIKCEIYE